MAANVGRNLLFAWGDSSPQTEIPGVREKSIAMNGESINVTSGEDDGKRQLLDASAEDQLDISLSGVTKDKTLRKDWLEGNRTQNSTLTWPDGDTITGKFRLASLTVTGTYNDAITFEAELQSAGDWTYSEGS